MGKREYVEVRFRPGDKRLYTFHNEGPALLEGDRVVVHSRQREQTVEVVRVGFPEPGFPTKPILRMADASEVAEQQGRMI